MDTPPVEARETACTLHPHQGEQETGWPKWVGHFVKEDSGLHMEAGVESVDQVKGEGYGLYRLVAGEERLFLRAQPQPCG
jgi:hypothetical protein